MKCLRFLCSLLLVVLFGIGCASPKTPRGSSKALYTIAETLEVNVDDVGKEIQLRLNQDLFFHLMIDPAEPGDWELLDFDKRTLKFLSDTPRTTPGYWGVLFRGNALGTGYVTLRFTPTDTNIAPHDIKFEISIRK
jgi:hypothetical protein